MVTKAKKPAKRPVGARPENYGLRPATEADLQQHQGLALAGAGGMALLRLRVHQLHVAQAPDTPDPEAPEAEPPEAEVPETETPAEA